MGGFVIVFAVLMIFGVVSAFFLSKIDNHD